MNEHISLAAGVIIVENDHILLVYEKGHWSLPKGKKEVKESMMEAAIREAKEETGLDVLVNDVAFVTEFIRENNRYYIQVYYEATIIGGEIHAGNDPDQEIEAVEFKPIDQLDEYLSFEPRLVPLKKWLKERKTSYHFFNLT